MARFSSDGLYKVLDSMKQLQKMDDEVGDLMLQAGAKEIARAWESEAKAREFKDSGDMIASIGPAKRTKKNRDSRLVEIYPQGEDRTGTRNAEKAFILHYGSSRLPRTQWVDDAEESAAAKVEETMQQIWDDYLKQKGLI